MKARINEWLRTALIMLGESIKLREMEYLPFIFGKELKLRYTKAARLSKSGRFSFRTPRRLAAGASPGLLSLRPGYLMPSFLAISLGRACLLTMTEVVL